MIEVINNITDLKKIKDEWQQLESLFESPMLQYDWYFSCINTLCAEKDLHIIVIRINDEIVGIAPLCINKTHEFKRLELIGSSVLYESSNLLYKDLASLQKLLQAIAKQKLPTVLLRMPDNNEFDGALRKLNRLRSLNIKKPSASANYISVSSDWSSYIKQQPSKKRSNLKRRRKCLDNLGDVTFDISSPDDSKLIQSLQTAFIIEDNSWKGRNNSSLLKKQPLLEFFTKYLRSCSKKSKLRLCFLLLNGKKEAMHIAIEHANTLWILKISHSDELAHCSPGIQLANETIKYCFDNKLAAYEFLGSAEDWQEIWPIEKHSLCSIIILPFNLRGITALCKLIFRQLFKK